MKPSVGHGGEHGLRALLGAVEIARRCKTRRRLHQAGEQGGFGEGYVLGGLAEIALRGLLDAVGAGAEIDPVQIQFENLRLGKFPLQPEREQHLLQLAMDGTFLSQKEIFRQLLRDGGAALADAAVQNVGDQRARDAVRVDAVMLVEAPILDGEEGLRHIARQFLQRQHRATQVAAGGERAALDIHDLDRGRPLRDLQRLDRRQMRAGPGDGADAADDEPQRQHQAPIDQPGRAASACGRGRAIYANAARGAFDADLPAPGAARSLAATRRSGPLSNTGSRRAPDCPLPCAITRPDLHMPAAACPPAPWGHAKGGGLRGR